MSFMSFTINPWLCPGAKKKSDSICFPNPAEFRQKMAEMSWTCWCGIWSQAWNPLLVCPLSKCYILEKSLNRTGRNSSSHLPSQDFQALDTDQCSVSSKTHQPHGSKEGGRERPPLSNWKKWHRKGKWLAKVTHWISGRLTSSPLL